MVVLLFPFFLSTHPVSIHFVLLNDVKLFPVGFFFLGNGKVSLCIIFF